ncbi:hypothetical protein EI42_00911 [Thermosporothrix hazakensis]|uniref:Uncharacterized protein n=1 Tax=Thermosporothrix hazakensis TaxID=644383 RepID=A0A326UJ20_THEHA|nr:hypothetical protein EI42_00911 [Thermosporothrix hazakensis]
MLRAALRSQQSLYRQNRRKIFPFSPKKESVTQVSHYCTFPIFKHTNESVNSTKRQFSYCLYGTYMLSYTVQIAVRLIM